MVRRMLVVLILVGLGWAVGRAQGQTPDLELSVVTKDGKTTIECIRGCGLQWVERMVPNRAEAQKSFTYGPCGGNGNWPNGCPSGRLGGWITR